MKTFHIFHAINPCFEEVEEQQRKYVGSVTADSFEQAYIKSQNFDRHWNQKKPCRSTSVGDAIELDSVVYMVTNTGFRLLIEY